MDIAGKNLANPTALILSSIIMLKHMGLPLFAANIESALNKVYQEGNVALTFFELANTYSLTFLGIITQMKTIDLGGSATSTQFTNEIVRKLEKLVKP